MIVGILFYTIYIFFLISIPFLFFSKEKYKVLFPLISCAHFNATSFFKIGITFSFFEIILFTLVGLILWKKKGKLKKLYLSNIDRVYLFFLLASLISIIIAIIRIIVEDLHPSPEIETIPFLRSIMSLNKIIVFLPCLIIIRDYLGDLYEHNFLNKKILFYIAISGVLPSISILLQYINIGFFLIHNNPSFSQEFEIIEYINRRPAGLTNEASFFVYQLFFSFMAIFECLRFKLLTKKIFFTLLSLFLLSVILSLSRTGLLIYILFLFLYQFRNGISVIRSFYTYCFLAISFFLVKNINLYGFNIVDRLLSSFNTQADLSTIERYGSTEAILKMVIDKSLFLGVGIYNYGYYIKDYLPSYLTDVIKYSSKTVAPSFNFILQLMAEFGIILFIIFIIRVFFLIRKIHFYFVSMFFFFLFIFALSFQILNFSIPFIVLLFYISDEKDYICVR